MRSFSTWPAPLPDGGTCDETALTFEQGRDHRLLVVPALFDEANKMRRLTVEVMHRLDLSGIDSFLPDLPGCNDSLQPIEQQTFENWADAVRIAEAHFQATHLLTIRHGALLVGDDLPGWRYAPAAGKQLMRSMMRARSIVAKEAGSEESIADIEATGHAQGVELAGWALGSGLFTDLIGAAVPVSGKLADIEQSVIGGAGLWLRAEPDESPEQADAIAALIAVGLDQP